MASSSQVSQTKYDVFISFRGTDIRNNFLSHLKKELQQEHIDFYVDDKLVRGDKISLSLLKAIEKSHIALVIFSEDYASSKSCLEVLEKITMCKDRNNQIVIPVFYNIDPFVVRYQTRSYGDALVKHEKRYREKVKIWRSALHRVADLSGFHSSQYRDNAELVQQVAKSLSTRLNFRYPYDLRNLVGIDKKIAKLKSLMCQGLEDVHVIGIWGMGGVGKTTIACAIFNQCCFEYEGFCFSANLREESEKHGIIYLRNKILTTLLKDNDLHIGTPYGVPSYVERKLRRTKVLLVLDDINDSNQLESLVGSLDCFGPGSTIIITSRDKKMLNKIDKIYEVEPLTNDEALELFNLIALKESCLDVEWSELSRRVIEYTKGLAIAIKVLGHLLYGASKDEWKSQLKKLKEVSCKEIYNVLRLSYDSLDHQQKQIFLYIACCLRGYRRCEIIDLLDACGFSTSIELKVLRDKALITWTNDRWTNISMHDLIQELGCQISREMSIENPQNRTHLLDNNDIQEVLESGTGSEAIQSIMLDMSKTEELSLNPQAFVKMHKLMFLKFTKGSRSKGHVHLPQGLEHLPNTLRLLHWDHYSLNHLPSTFCAKNLVQLIMPESNLERLWDGVVPLMNLKEIDLNGSKYLVELPDFSMAKSLVRVVLWGCKNLLCVHPSILSLHNLKTFILSGCKKLTCLKSDVHLKSLSLLRLIGCSRLKKFSVTSENMVELNLSGTGIEELAPSVGCLNKLKELRLGNCTSLRHLPSNLIDMTSLKLLDISYCVQLRSIPKLPLSIESVLAFNCRSLQTLSLAGDWIKPTMRHIRLLNCMKLGQHLLFTLGLNYCLSLINHGFNMLTDTFRISNLGARVIYPGNKVPRWFKHRTSHGSATFSPHSELQGFIFCVILPQSFPVPFSLHVIVKCSDENNDDERTSLIDYSVTLMENLDSDHVCLFHRIVSLPRREFEDILSYCGNAINPKISFEFLGCEWKQEKKMENVIVLKECGVHPIYKDAKKSKRCRDGVPSDELQPFPPIKRLKLKQFDQTNASSTNVKQKKQKKAKFAIKSPFRRWKRQGMKERKRKSM